MAGEATTFDEADLNAFADGRLAPARAAALSESLASDRAARLRIDGWKRQNEGLRTLFASVLFEPVPVRLLPTTLAAREPDAAPPSPAEIRAPGRGSSAAVLAITAIGVALVGFMAGALATIASDGFGRSAWGSRGAEVRSGLEDLSLAERAAESYRAALADTGRGADFSAGDEARLQHWMSRQLAGAARIPDLHPLGWTLVAGRVSPGRYAPAAFLLYGRGAGRLGLYVARDPVPAALQTSVLTGDGDITVSSWSENGLGTALASAREIRGADGGIGPIREAVERQMTQDPTAP